MENKLLHYCLLNNKNDLARFFPDLCDGARRMIAKTGSHGQTAELIVNMMISIVEKEECFLLVGLDENEVFQGFAFAVYIKGTPGWVDFIGTWTHPGVGVVAKGEVFELLRKWATTMGATKIVAGITRSPKTFYTFFHKPLGFKPVGLILEYTL